MADLRVEVVMEQRKDQSSSNRTEGTDSAIECNAPKQGFHRGQNQNTNAAKPKRYKSCEDLSDHQLKQTHHQCWRVFQEFVHVSKKESTSAQQTRSAQSDTPSPTEPQRPRQTFRRLRSEPIGCTPHPSGETDGRRQPFRSTDRPNNANTSIEEEGEADCVVRSKPLDVVQVRPCALGLESTTSNCSACLGTHTRMPSNSSSSDKAPTPASDPPLFSPIGAGVAAPELLETYPPARAQLDRSPMQPRPDILVTAGTPESQRHLCCAASSSLPNEFAPISHPADPGCCPLTPSAILRSRIIAERLKMLGDRFEHEHGEERGGECLESLMTRAVLDSTHGHWLTQYIRILTGLCNHLSWLKISEIFSVGYSMLEKLSSTLGDPHVDKRWELFQKLWESTVSIVARWIRDNGGWGAFLRWTEGILRGGQSPRNDHSSSPREPRPRLWSLSEGGSLVDEDGVTLLEASLELEAEGEDEEPEGDGESSSDFEGSIGLGGTVFHLDDDPLHASSLPPGQFPSGHTHQGSPDDFCDSGITSSIEQLSLSPYENELHDSHTLSASTSSPTLPSYHPDQDAASNEQPLRLSPLLVHGGFGGASVFPEASPFDRNRSMSLPRQRRGQRPAVLLPRRASERAMDSLVYTVNIGVGAAFFYAAVSHFLNK